MKQNQGFDNKNMLRHLETPGESNNTICFGPVLILLAHLDKLGGYKKISGSTQLSMQFQMLILTKYQEIQLFQAQKSLEYYFFCS